MSTATDIQRGLINKVVDAYDKGDEVQQNRWVFILSQYVAARGFDKSLRTSVEQRFNTASDVFIQCDKKGNPELAVVARSLMSAYFAIEMAINGYTSSPEHVLEDYISGLAL